MKIIKGYWTKQYFIYLTRWMLSGLVMMPFMLGLEMLGLPLWLNLMMGQAIGSFIFFEIDKWIFKDHKTDNIEDIINVSVSERKL